VYYNLFDTVESQVLEQGSESTGFVAEGMLSLECNADRCMRSRYYAVAPMSAGV
jgi:hypothetical protein